MEEVNKGENVLEEEATTLKTVREGKGRRAFWENAFEGLNAPVGTAAWVPELRMKSQYAQKIASSVATHN